MAIPSRQIGGSTTTNLLWQISKQLEHLICIRSGGCGSTTTTSSSSTTTSTTTIIEPTTTTTTSYPISIECIVYLATNGNIYIYDPLTNLSVEILSDVYPNFYYQVANTDTKLWSAQGAGYIQEYDITFSPGPSLTYNRLINTGSVFASGTFAIDNTTLIVCDSITPGIYELDITTTTSINTFKGNIEAGYLVTDLLLTTSGKLIMVAVDIATNTITKVYQYDYATWTLETSLDLTSQLPALNLGIGIAQYNGDIYIFTRIANCDINTTPSGVYILDPLTNNITLINSTGLSCPSGASSWLPCNTTSLSSCCILSDVIIGTQTWTACNLDITNYQTGTPTLSLCGESCGTTLNGNVLEVTYADPNGGASLVQVGSTNSYTQITITGPGGGDGSTITLCLDDVTPPLDCTSCNLIALPNATVGGIGSVTYGDLIINTTYSGPTLNNTNDFITCTGKTTPINCLILGNNVGDFTYTLNFSEPVNNIKLLFAGGGAAPGSPYIEYYTFTTNDGDPIPQVQDPVAWAALTTGAWCYYNNDVDNGCTYGKLYNWYAVNDPRGLAPAGYHVPTDSDFTTLYTYLGGEAAAGGKLKETGLTHWNNPNTGATNSTGFTALGSGVRQIPSGGFNLIHQYGLWWSATDNGVGCYSLQLLYNDGGVVGWGTPYYKADGHSVRLIKNDGPIPTTTSTTSSTTTLAPTGFNTIYTHFEAL